MRARFSVDAGELARGRVRVGTALADEAARKLEAQLRALGVTVVVEPHVPAKDEIQSLDELGAVEEDAHAAGQAGGGGLALQLVSLDGEERPIATEAVSPSLLPSPMEAPPTGDDLRFAPPSDAPVASELQLDVPRPAPPPVAPPPEMQLEREPQSEPSEPRPPLRAHPSLPGWRGQLRERPPLRIAIGVVLALLGGWLLSQPYANRVERRVAELRAEADRERYFLADESRRRVATLDADADAQAAHGAVGTGAIWLLVAGASFAAWWKLT